MISFVIPCYNSEKTVATVVDRIDQVMANDFPTDEYEVILVNDCSKDHTKETIFALHDKKSYVKAIDLAKNVGQHGALMAGLNHAKGDYVVTLDDDGQTPIENLKLLMEKIFEGYDVASAKYIARNQKSIVRNLGTHLNRAMTKWLIGGPEGIRLSAFLVLRRFIVDEIVQYKNPYPYITGLIVRTTHNIANVDMEQAAREVGHSGYTLRKLLGLWLNGFTAFSVKPLRVATMLGLLSSFAGVIFAIITIVRRIILPNVQVGWSSLAVLILIIGGLILFVLGIMGEYVGRIYMCMNNTPQFIVRDMTAEMRDTVNGDRKDLA